MDRGLRRRVFSAVLLLVAGCVTTDLKDESPPPIVDLQPVTVPFGSGRPGSRARPSDQYYQSVVAQMQDALADRDLEQLRLLLERHDRKNAPEWSAGHIARFRALAAGLEFELHAAQASVLRLCDHTLPIGEPLPFELRLRDSPRPDIELPGSDSDHPTRFLVSVTVTDHDCYGGRSERMFSDLLPLPRSVDFQGGRGIELPFDLAPLRPEGALRTVRIRVELIPGIILLDGEPIPNNRVLCASGDFEIYPGGIEVVRENPYSSLRGALLRGDPGHFNHVWLAARFMPEEHREAATRLLIRTVRLGRPDQTRLAMASLAVMTGEPIPVDDRDGWLRWWQKRSERS